MAKLKDLLCDNTQFSLQNMMVKEEKQPLEVNIGGADSTAVIPAMTEFNVM